MQFPKQDIRTNILAAAHEEFLRKGFAKASIRNIATAAKTSKSNVYNYFRDKDALFVAVVEPTLLDMKNGLRKLQSANQEKTAQTYTLTAQKEVIIRIMRFVFAHGDDLKLLLFGSSASTQSGFKDVVTQELAGVLADWLSYAAPEKTISPSFIQTIARFYVSVIEQILAQDMTVEQVKSDFDQFAQFVYGGWKQIL